MTDALRRLDTTPEDTDLRSVDVVWADDRPAALIVSGSPVGRATVPIVELFTIGEQRGRTSQAYYRSAVGERLRVVDVQHGADDTGSWIVVAQRDPSTGIRTRTVVTRPAGTTAARVQTEVRNGGTEPVILTAVSSLTVGFGHSEASLDNVVLAVADSEWLAENRWREIDLRERLPPLSLGLHDQDGRGHHTLTSRGAWSAGEHVPCGVLGFPSADGHALAWQIETSAGWHVDISQCRDGGVLSLLGPTDLEHQFAHELPPGGSFTTVPVAIATSAAGRDGAVAELTRYRRWLRREHRGAPLPVVYNDFLNTLMGQPTTEDLLPLVDAAAQAGAEVFCIDAGWFAEPDLGDWWSTVGQWREAVTRFTHGLTQITDAIRDRGMRVGLWLEPEVVGADSPAAADLPDEAFFSRHGHRVMEHRRYHLDFRHPAARAHVDEAIDRLVRDHGVSYLKLDHNINPGAGTDRDATAAGAGLLGHTRALREWLIAVQRRHPGLLVENCSSGAMRADYSLLEVTHLQSTSDQQDFRLYPPIAASAPMSILPEQCGNWACPDATMSDEATVFTLVTGLSGRLYLSGFLHRLADGQRARVVEAVRLHQRLRPELDRAIPFWPLGLPSWDAEVVCLGLHLDDADLLLIWDRAEQPHTIRLPGVGSDARQVFPADVPWEFTSAPGGDLRVRTGTGIGARALLVARAGA